MRRIICISDSRYLEDLAKHLRYEKEIDLSTWKRKPKRKLKNTIAFLDLQAQPLAESCDLIRDYRKKDIKVFAFTDPSELSEIGKVAEIGVSSILDKSEKTAATITILVQYVMNEQFFLSETLVLPFLRELHTRQEENKQLFATLLDKAGYPMTYREIEIAYLLKKGLKNKEIAHLLKISEGTTKVHISNIYAKIGTKRRKNVQEILGRIISEKGVVHGEESN
ncbi:helix-turn-helix transcriptional regulator [Virgibacillus salexigens]|uniref:helix-turn-helix transcriptional regulator n=1 Tax=Virgibacillus TaxID=84406 RepID=UPI00136A8197|nr:MULTISPECIES: LuxR C-terminal-related transcriptional regulator [Virgibacillus]MYL40674.1 hypothetical protein [Virgibacillus massiliensis]